jgi:hypothetical protein
MKKTSQTGVLVLVRSVLLVFLSIFAAAAWAQSESTPPFPPPGRLVDVGGWRLHLNCTGEARASQPTVVLEYGKAFEEEHRRDHAAIAAMSRNGKLVIARHSGHHVQLDEPELVIKSIREVLAAVRK